jgi:GxxExxY protein
MTQTDADRSSRHVRECHEALFEEALTHKIIGAFYEVYRTLGHGFLESVYATALELELVARGLHVAREVVTDVFFKGQLVGVFRADMLVESRVVLELKAGRKCDSGDTAQLLNYLRATDLELGLLLHFGPRPAFKRLIASNWSPRSLLRRSSASSASSAAAPVTDNAVALPPSDPEQICDPLRDPLDAR